MSQVRQQSTDVRVGDTEREHVIERLKAAYAANRLDSEDLDVRLQLALSARTRNQLGAAMSGLEPPRAAPPARPAPRQGEERVMAALAHATVIAPIVVLPALIMATTGQRSAYVRQHAAEAMNFQLTLLLVTIVTFGLGAIVYAVAWAFGLVAAVAALAGNEFRYPWVLRVFGRC